MKLNLGCMDSYIDGWVNLDIVEPADVLHDLTVTPWPFDDDTVEHIAAFDILEHMPDFAQFMNECHRILEPGGKLEIVVPTPSDNFWLDPTHKRPYLADTFHIFCANDYSKTHLGLKQWSNVATRDLPRPQVPAVHVLLVK